MDTFILQHILSNQGSVDWDELVCNLGDVSEMIRDFSDRFVLCSFDGRPKVVAQTRLRLCWVRDCGQGRCGGLHLCKAFLLSGDCKLLLSRRGCSFSHDLKSEDNQALLRQFGLETLSRTELCLLLLQSDNPLLPPICHDYNNHCGCQAGPQGKCPRLHICERYLMRDCINCPREHDFHSPQALQLLRDKHIPDQLLTALKSAYANKQAVKEAKSDSHVNIGEAGDQNSAGGPSLDLTAYDSDSSSVVSVGQSESGHCGDPKRKGGRRRGGKQRGNTRRTPEVPSDVPPDRRYKTEICMFYIRGHCREEGGCPKAHDKMPYRWKMEQNGLWAVMANNEMIERDFCDPQNTYSSTSPLVCFKTMTCGGNTVRRLSTVNSVMKPHYSHTTQWLWYFKDGQGQWNQYSDALNLFEMRDQRLCTITSEVLEEKYLVNSEDHVAISSDMTQTNLRDGTEQQVRRRPRFVSAADAQIKRKCQSRSPPVQQYWSKAHKPQTGNKNGTSVTATKGNPVPAPSAERAAAAALRTSHHQTSPTTATTSPRSKPQSQNALLTPDVALASTTMAPFILLAPRTTSDCLALLQSSTPDSTSARKSATSETNSQVTIPTTRTPTSHNKSSTSSGQALLTTSQCVSPKPSPAALEISTKTSYSASTHSKEMQNTPATPQNMAAWHLAPISKDRAGQQGKDVIKLSNPLLHDLPATKMTTVPTTSTKQSSKPIFAMDSQPTSHLSSTTLRTTFAFDFEVKSPSATSGSSVRPRPVAPSTSGATISPTSLTQSATVLQRAAREADSANAMTSAYDITFANTMAYSSAATSARAATFDQATTSANVMTLTKATTSARATTSANASTSAKAVTSAHLTSASAMAYASGATSACAMTSANVMTSARAMTSSHDMAIAKASSSTSTGSVPSANAMISARTITSASTMAYASATLSANALTPTRAMAYARAPASASKSGMTARVPSPTSQKTKSEYQVTSQTNMPKSPFGNERSAEASSASTRSTPLPGTASATKPPITTEKRAGQQKTCVIQ